MVWCLVFVLPLLACAEEFIVFTHYYTREVDLGGGQKETVLSTNLYSIRPDGAGATQLTDFFPYAAKQAALSSDGTQLAFVSNLFSFRSFNYEDIFRYDIQGARLTRVTGSEYISAAATGSVTITVSDDVSSTEGDVTSGLYFSFQGCAQPLTYAQYKSTGALLNVPAAYVWVKVVKNKWIGGSGFVQVPAGGTILADLGKLSDGNFLAAAPSFSPDGTRIAAISGLAYYDTAAFYSDGTIKEGKSQYGGFDALVLLDLQGTMLDDNRDTDDIRPGSDSGPRYSPDGTKIAYCQGPITQESIIVVPSNNLNGTAIRVATGGTDFNTLQSYGFSGPDWSPDGTRIAYVYTVYDTSLNLTGNIVVANSDGSNATQITAVPQNATASGIDFSPDGQWVAYSLLTSRNSTLNITDLVTSNITADLYKRNIYTGEEVRLTSDGASSEPCWANAISQPIIPASAITNPGGTTTTTTPGGGGGTTCPFESTLSDQALLSDLREVCTMMQARKPQMVAAFYAHALEITAILGADRVLRENMLALISANGAALADFAGRGAASIDRKTLAQSVAFLTALQTKAGRGLERDLAGIIADLQSGVLLQQFGVTVGD
jgi:Tol biopolymer transport system component